MIAGKALTGRLGTTAQFHNSAHRVYGARMRYPVALPFLARLRRSPRFVLLMLMVFILRIGADVICAAHDMVEDSAGSPGIELSVATVDRDHPGENPFDVSGTCNHCGCHQVAAILPPIPAPAGIERALPLAERLSLSLPDMQSTQLRPPIV